MSTTNKAREIIILLTFLISSLTIMSCQTANRPEVKVSRFGGEINRFGKGRIIDIKFSPDGKFLAIASKLGIVLYDARTYDKVTQFIDENIREAREQDLRDREGKYAIAFSPDGRILASASFFSDDPIIRLWSVEEKRETATFKVHNHKIGSDAWWDTVDEESSVAITFSPDSQMLAIGSVRNIRLWSIEKKRETATFKNDASVRALAFSPDGQTLAVGNGDYTIKLWSISKGRKLATLGKSVSQEDRLEGRHWNMGQTFVTFSSNGQMLVSADGDCWISLWLLPERFKPIRFGSVIGPMAAQRSWATISSSPNMRMLASGHYDGIIKLWSVPEKHEITPELRRKYETGTVDEGFEITTLKKDSTTVDYLAFSPDGQTLISGHESGVVQIWNVSDFSPTLGDPPILSIEHIEFSENVLDAGETATLSIGIKNVGDGDAKGVTIQLLSNSQELSFPSYTNVLMIPKGTGEQTVNIRVSGSSDLTNGEAKIEIYLEEPYFKQRIPGKRLTFNTRKFPNPTLSLADYAVVEKQSASPNNRINLNEVVDLKFYVQNIGIGTAENVEVHVENNQAGVRWLDFKGKTGPETPEPTFSKIEAGKHELVVYRYHVNSEFTDHELEFRIRTTERYGKYGFAETKKFGINKKLNRLGKIKRTPIDDEAPLHKKPRIDEISPLSGSGNPLFDPFFLLVIVCVGFFVAYIIWRHKRKMV